MTTEERLEKMERELARVKRRYYWLLAAVGLVVGVCALVWFGAGFMRMVQAQEAKKVIRANEFVLEDENGETRAMLTLTKGDPELALVDEKRRPRAALGLKQGVPGLTLYDEEGRRRVLLALNKGEPELFLYDKKGQWRVILGICEGLEDENGKLRATLAEPVLKPRISEVASV